MQRKTKFWFIVLHAPICKYIFLILEFRAKDYLRSLLGTLYLYTRPSCTVHPWTDAARFNVLLKRRYAFVVQIPKVI